MPAPSLLQAQLRAGDPRAIARVRRALVKGKTFGAAARLLGVPKRTFESWVSHSARGSVEAVAALADELGLRGRRDWSTKPAQESGPGE